MPSSRCAWAFRRSRESERLACRRLRDDEIGLRILGQAVRDRNRHGIGVHGQRGGGTHGGLIGQRPPQLLAGLQQRGIRALDDVAVERQAGRALEPSHARAASVRPRQQDPGVVAQLTGRGGDPLVSERPQVSRFLRKGVGNRPDDLARLGVGDAGAQTHRVPHPQHAALDHEPGTELASELCGIGRSRCRRAEHSEPGEAGQPSSKSLGHGSRGRGGSLTNRVEEHHQDGGLVPLASAAQHRNPLEGRDIAARGKSYPDRVCGALALVVGVEVPADPRGPHAHRRVLSTAGRVPTLQPATPDRAFGQPFATPGQGLGHHVRQERSRSLRSGEGATGQYPGQSLGDLASPVLRQNRNAGSRRGAAGHDRPPSR